MNGASNQMGHIEQEDLALFAMQLLTREETAEVAAHLEACPACRRALGEVHGELALYAHTVDLHSPPAQARERLMKQVAREKKTVPADREMALPISISSVSTASEEQLVGDRYVGGSRRGLGSDAHMSDEYEPKRGAVAKIFPWVGWAVAAGLAVAAGDLYRERNELRQTAVVQAGKLDHLSADAAAARQVVDALTDNTAMRVNLTTKAQTSLLPQGRVTYKADKGTLIFFGTNLEPLQPAKTYELWLIPATQGQAPMPVGTFRPDERGYANLILPPIPKGVEAKAFGVTVEADGGSLAPTLPIILVGE